MGALQITRWLWVVAGWAALGSGVAGIVLPLVPTTPFLLLAAFCFARGSKRLHAWLLSHRVFGPPIVRWQSERTIAVRTKWSIAVAYGLTMPVAIWLVPFLPAKIGLFCGMCVGLTTLWLWPSERRVDYGGVSDPVAAGNPQG